MSFVVSKTEICVVFTGFGGFWCFEHIRKGKRLKRPHGKDIRTEERRQGC